MIDVLDYAMTIDSRFSSLPRSAYVCGVWVVCSEMSRFYSQEVSESFRGLLSDTLGMIRAAIPERSDWDQQRARMLRQAWHTTLEQGNLPHGGVVQSVRTLDALLGELSGDEPPKAAVESLTYMVWFMEEAQPQYTETLRNLTHARVEPESFVAIELGKLNTLCDVLEDRVAKDAQLEPERIAATVYSN